MTKGTPWTVEEEIQLKTLVESKTPLFEIASKLGRQPGAIAIKCQRLGLPIKSNQVTAAPVPLPEELPSVEEALKMLAGALKAAMAPGLSALEIQRLQLIINSAQVYQDRLADYLNYRGIEKKLNDMEARNDALLQTTSLQQTAQNNAPKPATTEVATNTAQ